MLCKICLHYCLRKMHINYSLNYNILKYVWITVRTRSNVSKWKSFSLYALKWKDVWGVGTEIQTHYYNYLFSDHTVVTIFHLVTSSFSLDNRNCSIELYWLDEIRVRQIEWRQRKRALCGATFSDFLQCKQSCNRVSENPFSCHSYRLFCFLCSFSFFLGREHCINYALALLHELWNQICCEKGLLQHFLDERQTQKPPCPLVVFLQNFCQPCKIQCCHLFKVASNSVEKAASRSMAMHLLAFLSIANHVLTWSLIFMHCKEF